MKKSKVASTDKPVVKSAIETATDELDTLVKAEATGATAVEQDPASLLAKAAADKAADLKKGEGGGDGDGPGGMVISGGKGGDRDEDDDEDDDGDEDEASGSDDDDEYKSVRGAFYDELFDHPQFGKVVEASPVLQHMSEVMGKSFEFVMRQNADLRAIIKAQARQMQAFDKSQTTIMQALSLFMKKSLAPGSTGMVKAQGAPGVMGRTGNLLEDARADKAGGALTMAKSEIQHRLTRAMTDGKIDGDLVIAFDSPNGMGVLGRVPEDVRKAYGIPDPPQAG